ncbi:MAG: DUF748 domain-containing protein [Candidatus Omnitrophica bacterium]|nr:DUF748 domain-containing protein [Candidatus Omnitrophota bacterium]
MKKILIALIVIAAAAATAIFIYRYQLVQYSADKIIRSRLPGYVKIDTIIFDARASRVSFKGFRILNPPDFANKNLLEIEEVSCSYKMNGMNIAEGFEIYDPVFRRFLLNIEHLSNGKLNLTEMSASLQDNLPKSEAPGRPSNIADKAAAKAVSDFIKLPEQFSITDGRIIFTDRFRMSRPYILSFENINGNIFLRFDERYTRVLGVNSTGEGLFNGRQGEVIKWDIKFDPTAPRLTMSNRFEVWNLEITPLEPYYDRYSPLVFKNGVFSGLLIFDFDNGRIGSTNEIHLADFRFYVKPGYENAAFWETTVPDLVKYFSTPSGEIVFDFKIKGDMENPQFYLGPISKQALAAMAIDKISSAIQSLSNKGPSASPGGPKSDIEKAKEYIDLFKGMIKK